MCAKENSSKLKEIREKLKKKFANIIDTIPIGVFAYNTDYKIVYANEKMEEILDDTELIGKCIFDFIPEAYREEVKKSIQKALEKGNTTGKSILYEIKGKSDKTKWLEIKATLLKMDDEFVFLDFVLDRTKEIEAHKKHEERGKRLNELFENAYDAIFFETLDGTILNVNKAACKMLGYSKEELIGMNARKLVPEKYVRESEARMRDCVLNNKRYVITAENIRKDGTTVPVEISLSTVDIEGRKEVIIIARDITKRRKLEEQLLQTQKMETLGILAGGFAHDFNNLLSGIFSNIDLYKYTKDPEKREKFVKRIEKIANEGQRLVKEILVFSKKHVYNKESIDLVSLISDVIEMVKHSFPKIITVKFNPYVKEAFVSGNKTYLAQIFLNLLVNARDAIGDREGFIEITLAEKENTYFIEVKDTVEGMDEETLDKIFEPFFTTKRDREKKGTGLGLTIVYNIVERMGGSISVTSRKGEGTIFSITLPKVEEKAKENPKSDEARELERGSGKVLFIDDEEDIRETIGELLKEIGYRVITARDGEEGLEKVEKEKDIDVIVLDMIMPKLDGKRVLERLSHLSYVPPVIIATGYADFNLEEIIEKYPFVKFFIYKPYRIEELAELIRRVKGA